MTPAYKARNAERLERVMRRRIDEMLQKAEWDAVEARVRIDREMREAMRPCVVLPDEELAGLGARLVAWLRR